jgi:hypothetical protein
MTSRRVEEILEITQRDVSPLGPVGQLVPEFVQRALQQTDVQEHPQVLLVGREQPLLTVEK